MYLPGETLEQGVILEPFESRPKRSSSDIYTLKGQNGLLARNGTKRLLASEMPVVNQDLAEALFRLSDEYDVDFPGIGSLAIRENQSDGATEEGYTYTTANIVTGLNMHHDMANLPFGVTASVIDKMLTYYEDMSCDFSSRLYLADLSLRQCIFGRAGSDDQAKAYFVDYDPRFSNISKILFSKPFANFGEGFGGIAGLDDDLYALKSNYPGQNYDEIAERLLGIANHQGIFYKVPTAYYHVNGLTAQLA